MVEELVLQSAVEMAEKWADKKVASSGAEWVDKRAFQRVDVLVDSLVAMTVAKLALR